MKTRKSWVRRYLQQEPDHEESAHGRGDEPREELRAVALEPRLRQVERLEAPRPGDDRQRHEERESSGRGAIETDQPARGDRDPGTRDARLQRERLCRADEQPGPGTDRVEPAVLSRDAVHDVEHDPHHGEHHGDQHRLPELVLDHRLERRARDHARDRADDDRPREALVGVSDRACATRRDERLQIGPQVGAEIDHGAEERAHVQGDVERLVERRIVDDVPSQRPGHEDQVAAARDGRELGDPLDDAEDDGLQDGHGARVYPGACVTSGVADALIDGVSVAGARAARPSVALAAAWSSWRAVSGSTSSVTDVASEPSNAASRP